MRAAQGAKERERSTAAVEAIAGRPAAAAVGLFVCLAYGAAWALLWPASPGRARTSRTPSGAPVRTSRPIAMMFTPGLAALLVAVTAPASPGQERSCSSSGWPASSLRQRLALRSRRHSPELQSWSPGSWGLGLLIGWVQLDPERSVAKDLIIRVTGEQPPMPMALLALLQLLQSPIGIAITAIAATGEEIGWRGGSCRGSFPSAKDGRWALAGVIWGLWHAPAILLGLNYEQRNPLGIIMMAIGCVGAGVLIGWLRLASASLAALRPRTRRAQQLRYVPVHPLPSLSTNASSARSPSPGGSSWRS